LPGLETDADRVERVMTAEPVDVEWAKQRESELRQVFKESPGATIERIECRSTLCKLELNFESTGARDDFYRASGRRNRDKPHLLHETMTIEKPDRASLRTVMYLTRPGFGFSGRDGSSGL